MSRRASALDEEPFLVDSPGCDKEVDQDESVTTSDEDDDDDDVVDGVSIKERFEEITTNLKKNKLDLRDADTLKQFADHNASFLGQKTTGESDHKTLLHLLVEGATGKAFDRYQPLVKLLIEKHRKLLEEKDSNEKTSLYLAISKKRNKLVRLMCETCEEIDSVLAIVRRDGQNCLHAAIHYSVTPKLAIFLVDHASQATLCARDDRGNTPLNLAVDYKRCTDAQLEIVRALIRKCDKAMDRCPKSPKSFSPYLYHEHTRLETENRTNDTKVPQATRDDGSTARGDDPGGKEGAGLHSKKMPQPKDLNKAMDISTVPKGQVGSLQGKFGPPNRNITSNEAPGGKYVNVGGSGGGGGFKTAGAPSGEPKTGPTVSTRVGSNDGKESNLKTPTPTAAARKRLRDKRGQEEARVTRRSAATIRNELKLHYMRTRNHDDVVDFLHGRNQENQIYFDLSEVSWRTISEEHIGPGLEHMQFEDVLQYVALPSKQLEKELVPSKLNKPLKPDGKGRSDIKGVKRVIRVIVDDILEPPHSDEAIEKALRGLEVEIWHWRKFDLCTETIVTAAPDTKEVCLYWSGNNAVLRGWSEQQGLPQLKKLKKVYLHVKQGLESKIRMNKNIRDFLRRVEQQRGDVVIKVIEDHPPQKHDPTGGPVNTAREQIGQPHRWLTCMDGFAEFIQNVDAPPQLHEKVTVALIDDGVDLSEQTLHAKIFGGRSFCHRDESQNLSQPYYVTSGGHGTVMASLICRVCPKVQLYVVKLDEHVSEDSKRQITAKSAAKAVRSAIDMKVHIISMSWTIERTASNTTDIDELEHAIAAAANARILMFCAAKDQGVARDNSFPAACGRTKHLFKIGAAKASGSLWEWAGDPADVDFIFPGHNVLQERSNDAPLEKCQTLTGSSVATAIAAGLAALVLYCVQLGALNMQEQSQQQPGQAPAGNAVTMDDFKAIKGHKRMKEALQGIGTSQYKYVEVWDVFEGAAKKAEGMTRKERIEIVTDVAIRLKTRKTFE